MKKLLFIFLAFILYSCGKTSEKLEYFYFNVKNNTPYDVTMTIFNKEDNAILKSYNIDSHELVFIDTAIYKVVTEGGGRTGYEVLKGEYIRIPIWNSRSTALNYRFGDFKISLDQTTKGGECDSASLTSGWLCNYVKRVEERKEATESTELEIHETATFYITNQQFVAADSI